MSVYFGGSRNPQNISYSQVRAVVYMVAAHSESVHVGCQLGADQAVISAAHSFTPLHIFTVAPQSSAPAHVLASVSTGHAVGHFSAGGQSAPIPARFLLRSIAAFQGCSQAVFFSPGAGSLAVARECVRSGLQVFAFQQEPPAPIPSCRGQWCITWFYGFQCWGWGTLPEPQEKQLSLFS